MLVLSPAASQSSVNAFGKKLSVRADRHMIIFFYSSIEGENNSEIEGNILVSVLNMEWLNHWSELTLCSEAIARAEEKWFFHIQV